MRKVTSRAVGSCDRFVAGLAAAATAALLGMACTGSDAEDANVVGVPRLTLGPAETVLASPDPDAELLRAWSAARLSDGRIAVANGRPVELRVYGADGALAQVVGRDGEGPGEYRGRLEVFATPGDSLLVWDHGTRRWQLFGPDGGYVRLHEPGQPTSPELPEFRLLRRSLIAGSAMLPAGCGTGLVAALDPPSATWREVLPTRDGVFWVRDGGGTTWRAHHLDGSVIADVELPAGVKVVEAGAAWFLVREAHEGEADRISVLPVSAPMPTEEDLQCPMLAPPVAPTDSARVAEFAHALREALIAGEMHYAERMAYPTRVEEVTARPEFTLPAGSDLGIVSSSTRGWSVILLDRRSTLACVFGIGDAARVGWSEGRAVCAM